LENLGYAIEEFFPVYADKMPTQLLAYLRMARVQDPGLLAKVCWLKVPEDGACAGPWAARKGVLAKGL